jgi:hypothetical protein
MRKILSITLICLLLLPLASCYKAPKYDIAVYITETGEKYHKKNCRYLNSSKIEINLSKALYDKYERCKVCKPKTQEDLDKLNEGK